MLGGGGRAEGEEKRKEKTIEAETERMKGLLPESRKDKREEKATPAAERKRSLNDVLGGKQASRAEG